MGSLRQDQDQISQNVSPGEFSPPHSGQLGRDIPQNPSVSDPQLLLHSLRLHLCFSLQLRWGDASMSSSSSCTSESLTITPCTTTTGATCQFPFRYAGVVYTECATVDQSGPWCSTSITATGEHIPGSEG